MKAALNIGENNRKYIQMLTDLVLRLYTYTCSIHSIYCLLRRLYHKLPGKIGVYDTKVNVDVMYVHTYAIAFYIRVCLTISLSAKLRVYRGYVKCFLQDYELVSFDYNITSINNCVLPQSY